MTVTVTVTVTRFRPLQIHTDSPHTVSQPYLLIPLLFLELETLSSFSTNVHALTSLHSLLRLPKMLLEHGVSKGVPAMIMVCQPCRVAATALRNWLQLTVEGEVGLRLEDGVRARVLFWSLDL